MSKQWDVDLDGVCREDEYHWVSISSAVNGIFRVTVVLMIVYHRRRYGAAVEENYK